MNSENAFSKFNFDIIKIKHLLFAPCTARTGHQAKSFPQYSPWPRHIHTHNMKPIFVAATRQHVGKTTVSLALMSGAFSLRLAA